MLTECRVVDPGLRRSAHPTFPTHAAIAHRTLLARKTPPTQPPPHPLPSPLFRSMCAIRLGVHHAPHHQVLVPAPRADEHPCGRRRETGGRREVTGRDQRVLVKSTDDRVRGGASQGARRRRRRDAAAHAPYFSPVPPSSNSITHRAPPTFAHRVGFPGRACSPATGPHSPAPHGVRSFPCRERGRGGSSGGGRCASARGALARKRPDRSSGAAAPPHAFR